MKHLLFIITVLLLFAVAGCSKEPEKTAEGWAVEAACERYEAEEDVKPDALITVEEVDYYFVDEVLSSKVFKGEEGTAGMVFKISFEDIYNPENNETFYVSVCWNPEMNVFELEKGYKTYNTPFPESAIVDIDIEEVGE